MLGGQSNRLTAPCWQIKACIAKFRPTSQTLRWAGFGLLGQRSGDNANAPDGNIKKLFSMKTLLIGILLVPVFCGCSSETQKDYKNAEVVNSATAMQDSDSALMKEISEIPSDPEDTLRNFTKADVAKFVMATVMLKSPKIMSVKKADNNYVVSYTRPDDGQKFVYKVKVEGNKAVWANIDGRWRDSVEDEQITFTEAGKKLLITQMFSDGSVDTKGFDK